MATGNPVFPVSLDTDATLGPTSGIIAGVTPTAAQGAGQGDQLGITQNLINTLIAIETKVGVNNSAVTSTLEYRIRKFPFKTWIAAVEGSGPSTTTRNSRTFLAFPAATLTTALFFGIAPLGSALSAGVTVRLNWMAATATSGNVFWSVALERLNTDQDSDSFDTAGTATVPPSATNGIAISTPITFTTIDGLTAGDGFCLRVQRLATAGMLGDAQLQLVSIESAA